MSAETHDVAVVRPSPALPPLEASSLERQPLVIPITPDPTAEQASLPSRKAQRPQIATVLRSKVQAPPLRDSTLSRQRLLDRLAAGTRGRVTLVVADAGYGKTTLLADFSRRFEGACLWYRLEPTDADWVTIVNHIIASVREAFPSFGEATHGLLEAMPSASPPMAAVVGSLLKELEGISAVSAILVIDDLHAIDDSGEAMEVLSRMILHAPRNWRFVLASRHRPALRLARYAATGDLTEMSTADLRFTRDETQHLFAFAYRHALDDDVVKELDSRTHGWAACLQLFSSLVSGRSASAIRAAARSLSGVSSPIYDYLAQEVVAHLPSELQAFLMRAALLEQVTPEYVRALFPDESSDQVAEWMARADELGLLSFAGRTHLSGQFHPLLREHLLGQLEKNYAAAQLSELHARIAMAAESDPLVATHHYIAAGRPADAVRCLGSSIVMAMGSGRWGAASQLAAKLDDVPPDGAITAVRARGMLEDGDLAGAADMLRAVDISAEDPTVRSVFRHTKLSLSWRDGNIEGVLACLGEILADEETPRLFRDISQVFLDSSPAASHPIGLAELGGRLRRMGEAHAAMGYDYYAGVSLHNAAIAALQLTHAREATELALSALEKFDAMGILVAERYSTHAVLAACALEAGNRDEAEEHFRVGLASGLEHADVHAEFAQLLAAIGERPRAARLLVTADERERQGHTDLPGRAAATIARSLVQLPTDPAGALSVLCKGPEGFPMDLGYHLMAEALKALCYLLQGDRYQAQRTSAAALDHARMAGNRRCELRLALVNAMAHENAEELRGAIADAGLATPLALAELADAIGLHLHLLTPVPSEVEASIAQWPARWVPVLRKQLQFGDDLRAHTAAQLLDAYGTPDDVGLLRAFEKTYRRRRIATGLGRSLARRVSPRLHIQDLGQVLMLIGGREIKLSRIRRRPASLLMYLVCRPNFTATREQVLEDLWPEGDIIGGSNSLNQCLYFIRREIDPWYEDDLSAEYVAFESELVWLDPMLVTVDSADFLVRSRDLLLRAFSPSEAIALAKDYRGQFCPEFEYEDWAISWRSRVHAAYLDFASASATRLAGEGNLAAACDIALRVLTVDPTAGDIERQLIWLYWHSGATSAAEAQYSRLAAQDRADGLEPPSLSELVSPSGL